MTSTPRYGVLFDQVNVLTPTTKQDNQLLNTTGAMISAILHIAAWLAFAGIDVYLWTEVDGGDKVFGRNGNATTKFNQLVYATNGTWMIALACGIIVSVLRVHNHFTMIVSGLVGSLAGSIFTSVLAILMLCLDDTNSDEIFLLLLISTVLKTSVFFTVRRNDMIAQFDYYIPK